MRISLLSLFFLLLTSTLTAQAPVNDNCGGAIDLGTLPIECSNAIYNNVNAAAADLGLLGGVPACFNGGNVNRDVYFTFTTSSGLVDVSIILQGTDMGANGPITNPQVAIYRGDCGGLAFLGFCASAASGDNQLQLDILGLTPNNTYYLVVNDYSATAAPNSGDFTLCVEEYVPAVNIGDAAGSGSCFGTLYDDGGPDGDYSNNQNLTFTIDPDNFHQCIEINVVDFQLEDGFDFLNFYAGSNTDAPLIASLTGFSNGQPFVIQAGSPAVTVQLDTDPLTVQAGFELTWSCSPLACDGTTFDNAIPISGLPFNQGGFSTCEDAANLAETPCNNAPFLNGPEVVFVYESAGGFCADVSVIGASPGTGIAVLSGPPGAPGTICLSQSTGGTAAAVDFQSAGAYYIVVANGQGCTDFGLSIAEAPCSLNPSLQGALCNSLNGCVNPDGLPSTFVFNQGFEDISFTPGVNDGCWGDNGLDQPNYYWFSIEAQANGPFGFIVQAANPAEASDIDFNVWGPFTRQQACEDPIGVQNFVETNQPIRSSWAGGTDPTGLAQFNANGEPVTDPYDCDPVPGAFGADDFASVIMAQEGEVYVVLINDWQDNIASGAISVDWSPSDPEVIGFISNTLTQMDTAICVGESVQLIVENPIGNVTWITGTETLSCTNCPNPIATPTETTTYQALVEAVCFNDTVEVTVNVFEVDAGPDVSVCRNEVIQLVAGSDFTNASYLWTAPNGVELSCTDCPAPFVTANETGTYDISVTLTGIGCTLGDQMTLTVLDGEAPDYNIGEDQQICIGESVNIGGEPVQGVSYSWTSNPPGFSANISNPEVAPDTTTTYYLEANGPACPVPSFDSVRVEVFLPPVLNIRGDTSVCQGDSVLMGNTVVEPGVAYTWSGPAAIEDPTDPNSLVFPQNSGTYTLTAVREACTETASFEMAVTPIAIEIQDTSMAPVSDTLRICLGEEVVLNASITPADSIPLWTSTQPGFDTLLAPSLTLSPESGATYYAEIGLDNGCFRIDSVFILVDSLPYDMTIMPEDTTVCEGALVLLTSPVYEPSDFPEIEFLWTPTDGQETPDTLYNMVIRGVDTTVYQRVATLGACVDTSFATVNVNPTPEITIMPSDTLVCPGSIVQLMATVDENTTEFEWIEGVETLSCSDCLDPVASPGGTTNYVLEAKNDDCPATASATVRVQPPPLIGLNPQTAVCEGESTQLNLAFDPNATYTWTATDPDFGTVVDPQLVVTPDETTTYFLVADNGLCDPITAEITIQVVPDPVLSAQGSAETICEGEPLVLTAQAENGQPEDQFIWTDGSGAEVGEGMEVTVFPDNSTTFTVRYVSSIGCGTLEDSVSVEVLPAPVADPIENTTICIGESVQLNLASDPATTYTWTSTDPAFTDVNNPEPVVSPTATATYTLTASNGVCPDVIAEITIQVIPVTTLAAEASAPSICEGESVTLSAAAPNAQPEDTFTWVDAAGNQIGTGQEVTDAPPASTDYTVTYVSGFGCGTLEATVSVEVLPAPVANPANDTVICLGSAVQLNFASDPATTYTWTSTDPAFTDVNNPEPVVSPTATATYTLTASNGVCPDVTAEITIQVIPVTTLAAEASASSICEGESVTLSAAAPNAQPEDTFTWVDAAGNQIGTGQEVTDAPPASTDYTVTYVSGFGCGTLEATVSVEVLPAPVADPANDTVICLGSAVQLNFGDDPGTTYEWTSTDPAFTDVNNPEPVVSPTATATYTLTASNGVCPDIVAEITVEVIGQLMLSINASSPFICPGEEVLLTAEVLGGGTSGDTYFWVGSDGTSFEGDSITVSPLGLTEYTLTYQDGAGCQTLVESVTLDVEPLLTLEGIEVAVDSAGVLYIGDQVFLSAIYDATGVPGPLNFTWTRNDSLFDSGQGLESIGETVLMEGEIIYGLTITTPGGCTYTDDELVRVEVPDIAVPNAFTPNGDGTNDFFNLIFEGGPDNLTILELKVFNRWGQLIYDNDNPGLGWDGTFNGNPQPSEVYFYMISAELANGEAHPLSPLRGDVTLLR